MLIREMTLSQSLIEEREKYCVKQDGAVHVLYLAPSGQTPPAVETLKQQTTALLSEDGWHTPALPKPPKLRQVGRSYVYALPPPLLSSLERSRRSIPAWDDLIELPSLTLSHFATSDYLSTLLPTPNLWTLIPQPHLLPSPHRIPQLPPPCPKEFHPKEKVSPYARSTLYIPISRRPPYDGVSQAMLSPTWPLPRRVDPSPSGEKWEYGLVIWTPLSIHRLWAFLIKIQEKGNCGPLGICYVPSHLASVAQRKSSLAVPTTDRPKKRPKSVQDTRKDDCAYVKVYCPTVTREWLVHALRNFPASREEGSRKPLGHAKFASVQDDGSVFVG
ncbi:hypothetical protein DACRYDRAFT_107910 [Dacryopinax primogenitus]|uniref:Uncharacterized protein n=1 Tax=Dacryopinax primogenitus (strain DJM 731) TaxID=1858805 RepID=M5G699_DACPD|nr:uncharacterized protein DACRYDRAFT_107910 [Dacryopinax primogenitus]EJU01357.1 hypothetical protein DACRYDRAFT_107910 [Dacryopinax primogenitus]